MGVIVILAISAAAAVLIARRIPRRYRRAYVKGVMQLEDGNTAEALDQFRAAVRLKPDFVEAQVGIVRALTERKQFAEALTEIEKAAEMGLGEGEVARLRGQVFLPRAAYRLRTAGVTVKPQLCDDVIAEDLEPAIQGIQEHADHAENPAAAYTLLGELYTSKSATLLLKHGLVLNQRDSALRLQRPDEAAEKDALAASLITDIRAAQTESLNALHTAIERDPKRAPARLMLAHRALTVYVPRPAQAIAVLEPLLQQQPPDRDALGLAAEAERLEGNYDRALEYVRALRKSRPMDPDLLGDEVGILLDAERWDEAAPLTEELITLQPNNVRVAYLRGKVLLQQGDAEDAVNLLQNIFIRESVVWPQARFVLAQALYRHGNREQATATFRRVLGDITRARISSIRTKKELREIEYRSNLILAQEMVKDLPELAVGNAKSALDLFPDRPEAFEAVKKAATAAGREDELTSAVITHALAVAALGGPDTGLAVCREAMAEGADNWRLRVLSARLLAQKGSYGEATEVLEALRKEFPREPRYAYELAGLHVRLGHQDAAQELYEELLRASPADTRALNGLFTLLVRKGDTEGARALLTRAEGNLGPDRVRAVLIDLALREKQPEEAVALARAQIQAKPKEAMGHWLLAELLWQSGDLSAARVAFDKALALDPEYKPAYRRGLLDLQEGKVGDAVEIFGTAYKSFITSVAAPAHLAAALHVNNQTAEAIELLEKTGLKRLGSDARLDTPRWMLAVLYADQGNIEGMTLQNRMIITTDYGLPEDRQALLERLADGEPSLRHDATRALGLLIIFDQGLCSQASLTQFDRLRELLPSEPLPACWRSSALAARGEYDDAVKGFEKIIGDHPDFTAAQLMLAETHAEHGDIERAVRLLEAALQGTSEQQSAWINLSLGKLHELQGHAKAAVQKYREAMKHPRCEPYACNNAAWLLATQVGDLEEALVYAQRAARRMPEFPTIIDTLGYVHYLRGDTDKAVEYLERARQGLPSNPTIRCHLGLAYLKAGQKEKARAELENALMISEDFPEAAETRSALESMEP